MSVGMGQSFHTGANILPSDVFSLAVGTHICQSCVWVYNTWIWVFDLYREPAGMSPKPQKLLCIIALLVPSSQSLWVLSKCLKESPAYHRLMILPILFFDIK